MPVGDAILDSVLPQLREKVARMVDSARLPGAAVGIVRGEELAWAQGFGYADIASRRPIDQDTMFRVGSITKTFTATAVMQLRDEGKLSLDDPVVRHVPEFGGVVCEHGAIEDVTLRRLLTHHSGLVGEPPLPHWETLEFPSMAQVLENLPRTRVVIEQDSAFKYSSLAFTLLGEVVERVSGQPYVDYIDRNLLAPLGMAASGFDLEGRKERVAVGYDAAPYDDVPAPAPHASINGMTAAGQLYSSVGELARWIAFQFRTDGGEREGQQVLRGRSLAEMHRPYYLELGWEQGYCLCWWATRRGDNIYHGHGGGIHGFISQVYFHKPTKTGAIVLTNSGGHAMSAPIALEVTEAVVSAERARPAASDRRFMPTPEGWRRFIGRYMAGPGGIAHIECHDGQLMITIPSAPGMPPVPPTLLEATSEEQVFLCRNGRYAGEDLTFRMAADGAVTGFAVSGFPFRKLILAG